ncbi:MAG: M15 family metallopeptidase [Lysobacteraceae bacterium]
MRPLPRILLNTARVEAWPAWLLAARSNRDARILSTARWVLRRKRDGRYLAAELAQGWMALDPHWSRESGIDAALDAVDAPLPHTGVRDPDVLSLHALHERLDALGLDAGEYGERIGLPLVAEPRWLMHAGFDRYRRPLWLHPCATRAWAVLRAAALRDGIVLEAISGYRSHDYQLGIFERKLARGLTVDDILTVNAAPGFSEHHSGRALDLGTPGEPPAEESFELTTAFAWLREHACDHGFVMSYPRDNPHGIVYEPWHWRYSELHPQEIHA